MKCKILSVVREVLHMGRAQLTGFFSFDTIGHVIYSSVCQGLNDVVDFFFLYNFFTDCSADSLYFTAQA